MICARCSRPSETAVCDFCTKPAPIADDDITPVVKRVLPDAAPCSVLYVVEVETSPGIWLPTNCQPSTDSHTAANDAQIQALTAAQVFGVDKAPTYRVARYARIGEA